MPKNLNKGALNRCVLNALAELKRSNNPFAELNNTTALRAAALMAETAAFNLATEWPSEDVAELIEISHTLGQMVARLKCATPLSA